MQSITPNSLLLFFLFSSMVICLIHIDMYPGRGLRTPYTAIYDRISPRPYTEQYDRIQRKTEIVYGLRVLRQWTTVFSSVYRCMSPYTTQRYTITCKSSYFSAYGRLRPCLFDLGICVDRWSNIHFKIEEPWVFFWITFDRNMLETCGFHRWKEEV